MHQPFDMSPGELPGAFFTDTGQWGDECPICGDFDCPFDNDHDDYAFAFNDPPPKPRTWFADLETVPWGILLCRYEFPEPVNVKNGDILTLDLHPRPRRRGDQDDERQDPRLPRP